MKFAVWAVCGVTFVAAVVVDWRAALLMFIACWADRILASLRRARVSDTLPKGQDAKQGLAGTEGSAVGAAETPNSPPSDLSTDKDG